MNMNRNRDVERITQINYDDASVKERWGVYMWNFALLCGYIFVFSCAKVFLLISNKNYVRFIILGFLVFWIKVIREIYIEYRQAQFHSKLYTEAESGLRGQIRRFIPASFFKCPAECVRK